LASDVEPGTGLDPELLRALRGAAGPDGSLPFDRFMEIALYHPTRGYYSRAGGPLGRSGDFYTAAHVAPLFGAAIGERILTAWKEAGRPTRFRVAELGPGDGTLALALLRHLGESLPKDARWEYVLVERSEALRARAAATASAETDGRISIRSQSELLFEAPFRGAILGNELLDAQPCRRFRFRSGRWHELFVRVRDLPLVEVEDDAVPSVPGPNMPSSAAEGALLEVSPVAEGLLRQAADQLQRGLLLFLDYGAEEGRWTRHAGSGTLTAYRAHRVEPDPLASPGATDLSVFVNFTRLREVAARSGLRELRFRRQNEALGAWGYGALLERWLSDGTDDAERVRRQLASKNLLFGFEEFYAWELAPPPPPGYPEGRPSE
jgi:SAM-dependent MidA family methyltransferase